MAQVMTRGKVKSMLIFQWAIRGQVAGIGTQFID